MGLPAQLTMQSAALPRTDANPVNCWQPYSGSGVAVPEIRSTQVGFPVRGPRQAIFACWGGSNRNLALPLKRLRVKEKCRKQESARWLAAASHSEGVPLDIAILVLL